MNRYPWDSRGRRLFPKRRPSFPTFVKGKATAAPGFPALGSLPSRDHFRYDPNELDDDTSSPSSVKSAATVQVRLASAPNQPVPGRGLTFTEDAGAHMPCSTGSSPRLCPVDPPITPRKSSGKKLEISHSAPSYTNACARENFQWKSVAHFHKARYRSRPEILSQLPNGERALRTTEQSHDPFVLAKDPSKCILPSKPSPCQWSQSPKITARLRLPSIGVDQESCREKNTRVVIESHHSPSTPVLKIATWHCTVSLSTVVTIAVDGRLHVHHLARVSIITPMPKIYAEKVNLSLVVTNALRTDRKCNLTLGQSSIMFREEASQAGFFPRQGAELAIERNSCDLEQPLNLYFAFTYPSPKHFVMTSLPTFRPKQGKSLSEVVFIAEPQPPLSLRTYVRDTLSSWNLCHHPVSQVTCYERINSPQLHAAHFQDDIQLRVFEPDPVRFRALGRSTLADVIWKLSITVYDFPGQKVECRMSFFVDVGLAAAIVSLNTNGWVPQYFIIDGRVATAKVGECWESSDGHITIFKQNHMRAGPIWVETYWQRLWKHGIEDIHGTGDLRLPEVADRRVLGGKIACRAKEVILLDHLGERIRPYTSIDETPTLFPMMDAGYSILLKRAQRPYRPVVVRTPSLPNLEDTQLSEHAAFSPDTPANEAQGTGVSQNVSNVKRKAVAAKNLLQALSQSLLVLFLLIPCFLLVVEHVRRGNFYDVLLPKWEDQDQGHRFDGAGESPAVQARVHAADSGSFPLQSAATTVVVEEDHAGEVAKKCEGWRDWIDYEGGWRGCVP